MQAASRAGPSRPRRRRARAEFDGAPAVAPASVRSGCSASSSQLRPMPLEAWRSDPAHRGAQQFPRWPTSMASSSPLRVPARDRLADRGAGQCAQRDRDAATIAELASDRESLRAAVARSHSSPSAARHPRGSSATTQCPGGCRAHAGWRDSPRGGRVRSGGAHVGWPSAPRLLSDAAILRQSPNLPVDRKALLVAARRPCA